MNTKQQKINLLKWKKALTIASGILPIVSLALLMYCLLSGDNEKLPPVGIIALILIPVWGICTVMLYFVQKKTQVDIMQVLEPRDDLRGVDMTNRVAEAIGQDKCKIKNFVIADNSEDAQRVIRLYRENMESLASNEQIMAVINRKTALQWSWGWSGLCFTDKHLYLHLLKNNAFVGLTLSSHELKLPLNAIKSIYIGDSVEYKGYLGSEVHINGIEVGLLRMGYDFGNSEDEHLKQLLNELFKEIFRKQ